LVPALETSNRFPASCRNRPSAIWLRAEFPVQRIRTRITNFTLRIFDTPVKVPECPREDEAFLL